MGKASAEFRAILEANGIQQSMSGKGECWDNEPVESFFGTMKSELGDPVWESRVAARDAIFDYIETWYNRKRRHSTLGYVSPERYDSLLPIAAKQTVQEAGTGSVRPLIAFLKEIT